MKLIADLHIHSVLSPCGDFRMTPCNIVRRVKEVGLNLFSITDHNSIGNLLSFKKVAERENLKFIFGMEVQTEEEVHVLTYFDSYESIRRVWDIIYKKLPAVNNNPDYFGEQILVNENDEIVGFEEKLLLNSVRISVEELAKLVKENKGIAIPAHINSFAFSILTQLGFIPDHNLFSLLEISNKKDAKKLKEKFNFLKNFNFVSFSDAHYLKDIGRSITIFYLEENDDLIFAFNKGKVKIGRLQDDE